MRTNVTWKMGNRTIGGVTKYFRSRWEANYARVLEYLKANGKIKKWEHEPEIFWFHGIKRGVVSYTPDFRVTMPDNSIEYHEVKGWMDDRSKTKIKRMAKYHPKVKLLIVDGSFFKSARELSRMFPGWE